MRRVLLAALVLSACGDSDDGVTNPPPGPSKTSVHGVWRFQGRLGGVETLWVLNLIHKDGALGFRGDSRFELRGSTQTAEVEQGMFIDGTASFVIPQSKSGSTTFFEKRFSGDISDDALRLMGRIQIRDTSVGITFTRALEAPPMVADWFVSGATENDDNLRLYGATDAGAVLRLNRDLVVADESDGAVRTSFELFVETGQDSAVGSPNMITRLGDDLIFYGQAGRSNLHYTTDGLQVRLVTPKGEQTLQFGLVDPMLWGGREYLARLSADGDIRWLVDLRSVRDSRAVEQIVERKGDGGLLLVSNDFLRWVSSDGTVTSTTTIGSPDDVTLGSGCVLGDGSVLVHGALTASSTVGFSTASGQRILDPEEGSRFFAGVDASGGLLWIENVLEEGAALSDRIGCDDAGNGYNIELGSETDRRILTKVGPDGKVLWSVPTDFEPNPLPEVSIGPDAIVVFATEPTKIYQIDGKLASGAAFVAYFDPADGRMTGLYSAPRSFDSALAPNGALYIGGEFSTEIQYTDGTGSKSQLSMGGDDYWYAKLRRP